MPRRLPLLALLLLFLPPQLPLPAQEPSWSAGTMGTGLLLRRLDGVKRVLLIGAHPDDEDTSLLAALARGMGAETAYLSLSRGEGGQNLLGEELDEGLGVLRAGELLAARALDGGRQFFARAYDFGFSRTAEETFRHWPREELLADAAWVVRSFRPHVIVSVFSGTPRDGHGHHQVAGMVAREVFDAAADPARFPEQLGAGVLPWAPLKLYRLVRGSQGEATTAVATGSFDPLLGRSHHQLAMESRSQHRSQDMGTVQPLGPRSSRLELLRSRIPGDGTGPEAVAGPDGGIFAGVDTTLAGLAAELGGEARTRVAELLEEYRRGVEEARSGLEAMAPWGVAGALARAREALEGALEAAASQRGAPPGGEAPSLAALAGAGELERVLGERKSLVGEALLAAAGVVLEIRAEKALLVPGEEVGVVVELWNGGPFSLGEATPRLLLPEGWEGRLEREGEPRVLGPGEAVAWRYAVWLPPGAEPSRPYYLQEPREGSLYRWPPDPSLWGLPGDPPPVRGGAVLTLGGNPEGTFPPATLEVERTAFFRGADKARGEFRAPLLVVPPLSLFLEPGWLALPLGSREAREVMVRVRNAAAGGREGVVRLELPEGWGSQPGEVSFRLREPESEASFLFRIQPPQGVAPGRYTLGAAARTTEGEELREGAVFVDYPHISRASLLVPARTLLSVFPVELDPGMRVGYVMGSGDGGAEALRQMGARVELLGPEAVRGGELGRFDALVLGIRAYETRPELGAATPRILAFAREGGTVLVQYNKYEYPRGGFPPYPLEIRRPHDRVTDESAPVRILEPEHPAFRFPNPIGDEDFQGWVQERGLYFAGRWDTRYTPLLEMADPGEEPLRGGLLAAPLGEGLYLYTGLAFFRQFPEGVPGAFRLFANLVSLRGSGGAGGGGRRTGGEGEPGGEGRAP